ncbi:LacI family transcriptional regulator [Frondihabitans sp. PhB188]|uniref:LacI family DNA-binding transcriptional regulator n=1 Tax=Frondihabitans sp. PhB188 TaxID=2485200 RepID=UPI000F4603E4|nr:LacI family DNA-binding transcriptional regulator [Frondihabitans sp. PhB188]ROQ36585.1 LacI family transcriptional regulator [Frondihabitans sp. PhB188]
MSSVPPRATIIDVAELAGVSRQTVTRALNGLADISPATRERVVAAARSLNYRPNRAAQGLVQGRLTTVGFVVDDLSNPYFAELASALSRQAAERDWSLLLCDVGSDPVKGRAQLASMTQGVDAVVLTGCRNDTMSLLPDDVLSGTGLRMPLVMLDGPAHPRLDARVVLDLATAIGQGIDHLAVSGRTRIAFVDSTEGSGDRLELYRRHVASRGLEGESRPSYAGDESMDGGLRAAREILAAWPDVDALVAYNDIMAIGALKALAEAGCAVPGDVAVIGIDGLAVGRAVTPELTTLAIDTTRLAREALGLLHDALGDHTHRDDPSHDISVPLTLTLRESA